MKAATAAAKSKGGCRQRTSVNSNKNKDEQTSDCEGGYFVSEGGYLVSEGGYCVCVWAACWMNS